MFVIDVFFVSDVLYDFCRSCQAVDVTVGNLEPCQQQYTNIASCSYADISFHFTSTPVGVVSS